MWYISRYGLFYRCIFIHFSTKDKGTNKEQKITLTCDGGLSEAEVEKMVNDAKAHEADDKKLKESVEKRNRLDGLILEIEEKFGLSFSVKESMQMNSIDIIKEILHDHGIQ